jgi:hypothetical protein
MLAHPFLSLAGSQWTPLDDHFRYARFSNYEHRSL